MKVQTGLERLIEDPTSVRGKRVALLTHQAAVTSDLVRAIDAVHGIDGCELVRIFEPEHGMWAIAQDMEGSAWNTDIASGVRVESLYEHTSHTGSKEALACAKRRLWPKLEHLQDIDAVVVDLQDVGARYYTFANTMAYCMEIAKQAGIEVIVLDRPNPINGAGVEGNLIDPKWYSFVGQFSIPARHGMTIGELARFYQGTDLRYACKLTVIPMRGWTRAMWFDDTGLPWVAPSPNMPSLATAVVYPGMCLIEATEASEGRGTTQPFELFGAPEVNPFDLAERLNEFQVPGVIYRPQYFKPTFQKQAGQVCGGVQVHVTDREAFPSYRAGLLCTAAIAQLWSDFEWRSAPYEYEPADEKPAINLLTGTDEFKRIVDARGDVEELIGEWARPDPEFLRLRQESLLY